MRRPIRDCFAITFRTAAGHKFRGEFGDPNSYPRPRKELQNLPHRSLTTGRAALATAGDQVTTYGVDYLLCGQHVLTEVKLFLAVQVNTQVKWERVGTEVDPVTKMDRDTGLVILAESLPVALEPQRGIEEEDFTQTKTRIFTAAAVQLGDYLDGMRVTRVADVLGLLMVEAA